jgi:hypothetical protein
MGGLRRLGTVMNRRKSIVIGSGISLPSSEKKSRPAFGFRRGDSSQNVHAQLPSTPPGRDTPSIASESVGSPSGTIAASRDTYVTEDSTAITSIPETVETIAATNGTTSNHTDTQIPPAAMIQVCRFYLYVSNSLIHRNLCRLRWTRKGILKGRAFLMILHRPREKHQGMFYHVQIFGFGAKHTFLGSMTLVST